MSVRKILITVAIGLGLAVAANAQAKVEVTQEFVDDANRAFIEVVALREVKRTHEAKDVVEAERDKLKDELIESLRREVKFRDEQVELYRKLKCDKTSLLFGLIKNTRCH